MLDGKMVGSDAPAKQDIPSPNMERQITFANNDGQQHETKIPELNRTSQVSFQPIGNHGEPGSKKSREPLINI